MTYSLNSTISLALDIAEHRTDSVHAAPSINDETLIMAEICTAIHGAISTNVTPSMWACIVDAQEASRLLTKSKSFGPDNHFQQTTYQEAANRMISEAVSWLV